MAKEIWFELKRKAFHVFVALTIAFFLTIFKRTLSLVFLLGILISGTYFYIQIKKGKRFWLISRGLETFEREGMISKWPGKGAFFLILGCFLTIFLFSEKIAFASILILGISDAAATIIGKPFGKFKIMYGRTMEGTTAFFFTSFLIISILFDYSIAPFVATMACLAEYVPNIDDNLTIPLLSGLTLWALLS